MVGKMMFVAVSKPVVSRRKPEAPEVDADQVVLQMVNSATRKRINEQKKQELIHRIEELQRREAAVLRREQIVGRKEAKQRAWDRRVNFIVDSLLVLFSTIGMVVTVMFLLGL